ncbi:MAG: serine/threonine-protein phosphatase [Acidimicrobiales bacterium]|nr:serine/threonine-protein phosphatase [Acidimicrobiales bacterium]
MSGARRDHGGDPPSDLIRFRWGSVTDVGRVRHVNQDRVLARDGLFVVADGMGGHQGGEIASQLAIEAIDRSFTDAELRRLVDSVRTANQDILREADNEPELAGMGTTLVGLALVEASAAEPTIPTPAIGADAPVAGPTGGDDDPSNPELCLAVANVGDSRLYRFADGELAQITEDHSLVEELVRSGRLSPDEADGHPQRNILTRALGVGPDVQVDVWELPLSAGDRFVLCSDGLFNEVSDAQIAATLRRLVDPEDAATELVRQANDHGGRDNVSVVVVNVELGDAEPLVGSPGSPAIIDLAGFSRAAPLDLAERRAPQASQEAQGGDAPRVGPVERRRARRPRQLVEPPDDHLRARRFGLGTIAFVAVLLGVLAVAAVAVGFYARGNYFVGVDGDELVVYQGRPGGVLWFDPTIEERTGVTTNDLTPALVEEVSTEPQYPTLAEARAYVDGLVGRVPTPEPEPTPTPEPSPAPTPTSIAEGAPTPTSIADGPPTPTSIAAPRG